MSTGRRLFDISRFGVQVPKLMRMVHEFLEGTVNKQTACNIGFYFVEIYNNLRMAWI